jgi:hypothetical protein
MCDEIPRPAFDRRGSKCDCRLSGTFAAVEEVNNSLNGLSTEARRQKLEEGARNEGKAVYYGTIQESDARELLDGFKRKYPFLQTGH